MQFKIGYARSQARELEDKPAGGVGGVWGQPLMLKQLKACVLHRTAHTKFHPGVLGEGWSSKVDDKTGILAALGFPLLRSP